MPVFLILGSLATLALLMLRKGPTVKNHKDIFSRHPVDRPVIGSRFGPRTLNGQSGFHNGQDYPCPVGTPVFAVGDGEVTSTHDDPENASGRHLFIRYENGYHDSFSHLSRIDVSPGDSVLAGRQVGLSGNTGDVSPKPTAANPNAGAHLHYVMNDPAFQTIDPLTVLPEV